MGFIKDLAIQKLNQERMNSMGDNWHVKAVAEPKAETPLEEKPTKRKGAKNEPVGVIETAIADSENSKRNGENGN